MDARRFLIDLMWDPTNWRPLSWGDGMVAALYQEAMGVTDDLPFETAQQYDEYIRSIRLTANHFGKRKPRSRVYTHIVLVRNERTRDRKVIDMRDVVPASEYSMAPRVIIRRERAVTPDTPIYISQTPLSASTGRIQVGQSVGTTLSQAAIHERVAQLSGLRPYRVNYEEASGYRTAPF